MLECLCKRPATLHPVPVTHEGSDLTVLQTEAALLWNAASSVEHWRKKKRITIMLLASRKLAELYWFLNSNLTNFFFFFFLN